MTEHLTFVMVQLQQSYTECTAEKQYIISELRCKTLLLTNYGYKRPNEVSIHFSKEYGTPVDVTKLISAGDLEWCEIDGSYLKHSIIESLPQLVSENSGPALIQLVLQTLAQFNFKGYELLEFAREFVVLYLDDEEGATRKDAAVCCCRLIVHEAIAILVRLGHDEEVASTAVLRNGHCYGTLDALSNIVHNAAAYLNCEYGSSDEDFVEQVTKLKDLIKKQKITGLCIKSRRFHIGNRDCRLIVYPRGQSQPPCHLSVFLEVTDLGNTSSDWSCFVCHRLSVVNQKMEDKYVAKESQSYSKAAKDWGWREFVTLTSLFDQDSRFLVMDTVVFSAEVLILKEKSIMQDFTKHDAEASTDISEKDVKRCSFSWQVENFLSFKEIMETRKIFSKFFEAGGCDTICIYLERINDNADKVDLMSEYIVSVTFNVSDLPPYITDDEDAHEEADSGTNLFLERENDAVRDRMAFDAGLAKSCKRKPIGY